MNARSLRAFVILSDLNDDVFDEMYTGENDLN